MTVLAKCLFHHDRWSGGNPSGYEKSRIPLIGRIIHLTDRITVLIGDETPILQQVPAIKEQILNESGREFDPDLVNLLFYLIEQRKPMARSDRTMVGTEIACRARGYQCAA